MTKLETLKEKCLSGLDITLDEALYLSYEVGQPIKFQTGSHGLAWPCGCVQFDDGTDEICSYHLDW